MVDHHSEAKETLQPPRGPIVTSTAPSLISSSFDPDMEKPEAPERASQTTPDEKSDVVDAVEDRKDDSPQTLENANEKNESDGETPEEDDESEYPKSWKLFLISLALCFSVFCMALDNTIIATAIPRITDRFESLDDVGWYVSSYLLTICSFQLMYGKLYTFYNIKWTYLSALFIFELGSLVCATAPTSEALIIGRAVAGLGSAGIFSGAILIIAHTVPLRQRPMYTGLIGGMYGIASVAGPLMGGAFTDSPRLTWRFCFWINLPFGFITTLFIVLFFKPPKSAQRSKISFKKQLDQMDLPGTFFFLPGVICLLLALQWGGTKYPWKSWRIILLLCLAGVLLACFVIVQIIRGEKATVPPRIYKNQNIWSCSFFGACLGGAFFVLMFYLPIWFQAIKGVSAVKSGIMNLPMILGLVIISMLSGVAVSVLGYYTPWMYLSVICMAVGAGLLATLKVNSGHDKWIGYQFLFGAGIGFGMQQTLIAAQTVLPLKDVPIGTAIMMFAQTLGGALFVSVGQNVFSNQLVKNLAEAIPDFDSNVVLSAGATQLKNLIPEQFYDRVLVAYNKALTETYYVSVALSCLAGLGVIWVQWKSVKDKAPQAVAAV